MGSVALEGMPDETLVYVDGESDIPRFGRLTAPQGPLEKLRDQL
ncbi:hypothetical protein GCM10010324_49820 [Streptomyces hiroshimensis]|uniref:Uncharacterized protein n=1 Tax=Streptomyces hiroshimensis TaxID=66424 RepID=A0ABQ2YYQ8_9ACTN|nr:hypothetical protein GCM10010324_49820 [Streptomyces hiroshimensis]